MKRWRDCWLFSVFAVWRHMDSGSKECPDISNIQMRMNVSATDQNTTLPQWKWLHRTAKEVAVTLKDF